MRRSQKKSKGFTLIELLVSVAILGILMAAASQIFARAFSSYQAARQLQSNTEDAQFILNNMAKELRTSSIASPSSASTVTDIKFFDYSKSECVRYRIQSNQVQRAATAIPNGDLSDCQSTNPSSFQALSNGSVTGQFAVTPSSNGGTKSIGKVTVVFEIQFQGQEAVHIQTTTSLRDYGYVGL
jgi:prepilin-type N-terminal cleavage/methylation domain-containing protein